MPTNNKKEVIKKTNSLAHKLKRHAFLINSQNGKAKQLLCLSREN